MLAMEIEEVLKALADHNRLRILNLLQDGPLCVCDLEEVLGINQSNLSRHLAKLKQAGLLKAKKQGLFIYYSLNDVEAPYAEAIRLLYGSLRHSGGWQADLQALAVKKGCGPAIVDDEHKSSQDHGAF